MKRIIAIMCLFCFLFIGINIFAYDLNKDDKIYAGGQAIGIKINNGVTIVGPFGIYKDGKMEKPWEDAGIIEGDKITYLNNYKITDIKSLLKVLNKTKDEEIDIVYERNGKEKKDKITPVATEDSYSLGIYVKDSILGVGTLTYYIDSINTFGSLGHQITSDDYFSGKIYEASVTEIVKPTRKEAGQKKATIDGDDIGDVKKNTITGVHGTTNDNFDVSNMTLLNFKTKEEVRLGDAEVWTCINGKTIEKFNIEITKLEKQTKKDIKGICFEVKDERLISKTGGIIQGMSGSPIIQDGKIIGAVTHVLLNNSKKGYGIYLEFMLEDMGIYIVE